MLNLFLNLAVVTNCCSLTLSLPFSLPISHHNPHAHNIGKECPAELTCLQYSPSMRSTEESQRVTYPQLSTKNTGLFMKEYAALQSPIVPQYYFLDFYRYICIAMNKCFCMKLIKYCIWRPESCIFTYDRLLIQLGANWLLELGFFGNSQGGQRERVPTYPKIYHLATE